MSQAPRQSEPGPVDRIEEMGRADLVRLLKGMRCSFALDFTDEFLDSLSLQRLRHIVLGAGLHDRSAKPCAYNARP